MKFVLTLAGILFLAGCARPKVASVSDFRNDTGSVSGIARVVRMHSNDLRICYGNARVKDPGVKGRALVEFSVEPGKPPKPVKIRDSSLNNKMLDKCILAQFQKWDFPRETELKSAKLSVTYPVELAPAK